jgi:hypothetical protein
MKGKEKGKKERRKGEKERRRKNVKLSGGMI